MGEDITSSLLLFCQFVLFLNEVGDCSVSEKLPCCCPCSAVVDNLGDTKKRSTKEVRRLKLS